MLDFDWDDANLEHIALHNVIQAEAEYVLQHPTLDLGYQDEYDEDRFAEVGATGTGRILIVITTWRGVRTRVVTAYDAPRFVAEEYRRKKDT